ncbi:MPN551 family DNA-binding protein [Ureaplasma ceti]|uniref:YqaJ viral recombinase family protein n=1 Tax=Ureaplasma ceti TaxID=3119530 RepID=A0ABP9UAT2_9BACT
MPFIKKYGEDFIFEDNQIKLTPKYLAANQKKFKKITGSRMASVLGLNNFSSPVKTWAMMVGIYTEPMDQMIANAGNIIEPKIKDYVEQKTGIKYLQYNPMAVKFDVFKEDPVFGGIPDGEPLNAQGDIDYTTSPMLEIKTSAIDSFVYKKEKNLFVLQKDELGHPIVKSEGTKRQKWFNSNNDVLVPNEYKFQLGLYCYLRHINHGIFAICFLKRDDYIDPNSCNVFEREIQLVDFTLSLDKFKYWVDSARLWYDNYIKMGVSPELSLEDREWFESEDK